MRKSAFKEHFMQQAIPLTPLTPQQIVQLGRDYRPRRLTILINHLMMCAEKEIKTKYSDVNMVCRVRSHHEIRILLGHVFALCLDNGWPTYDALVRNQDPTTKKPSDSIGNGFFDSAEKHLKIKINDRDHYLKSETEKCFGVPPPCPAAVSRALEIYILKHGL